MERHSRIVMAWPTAAPDCLLIKNVFLWGLKILNAAWPSGFELVCRKVRQAHHFRGVSLREADVEDVVAAMYAGAVEHQSNATIAGRQSSSGVGVGNEARHNSAARSRRMKQ